MRDFVGKKAREIKPSGIRKFFDIASEMEDVISYLINHKSFRIMILHSDQKIMLLDHQ